MARSRTAIVLVNWNGWEDSIACLRSCLALEGADYRIVLCDNDSADGSVEKIMEWAAGRLTLAQDPSSPVKVLSPRLPTSTTLLDREAAEQGDDAGGAELVIIQTGGNLGFAGGNNVGLRWAMAQDFDFAWLLNNDTVVPPDALRALVDWSKTDANIGLCGSILVEYHEPDIIQAIAGAITPGTCSGRHLGAGIPLSTAIDADALLARAKIKPTETLYPVGASMLASRRFLEEIGLMEESYFLYYEEADWVFRAKGRFRPGIAVASRVYHKHGASAGSSSDGGSTRAQAILYRSRLLFSQRFEPHRRFSVTIGILGEVARRAARGKWSKAKAAYLALTHKITVPHTRRSDGGV